MMKSCSWNTSKFPFTQIDYVLCHDPDLQDQQQPTSLLGVMDKYAAEALLEGKPEGTFNMSFGTGSYIYSLLVLDAIVVSSSC